MNQVIQSVPDRKVGSFISSSSRWFLPIIGMALFVLACSAQQGQRKSNAASASSSASVSKTDGDSAATLPANLPLRTLIDVPLTGGATRLDYQSLDSDNGRLYIAHLGSDLMTVFDVNKQTIVGDVKDLKRVHGVLAVPELHVADCRTSSRWRLPGRCCLRK